MTIEPPPIVLEFVQENEDDHSEEITEFVPGDLVRWVPGSFPQGECERMLVLEVTEQDLLEYGSQFEAVTLAFDLDTKRVGWYQTEHLLLIEEEESDKPI